MKPIKHRTVTIIGAGPAGAVAAALLKRKGHEVLILERQQFPRFSIGESLLAHCLEFIEEAGMLPAVQAAGFQIKNGAAFGWGDRYTWFDFRDKFSPGPGTTFQVQRAHFDQIMANEAMKQGVEVRYRQEVISADFSNSNPILTVRDLANSNIIYQVQSEYVLDASGYGRVLARLLDLESPSSFPPRKAIFTHIEDRIDDIQFDREKILISIHPQERGIWYWVIPFSSGRSSVGVVGKSALIAPLEEGSLATLRRLVDEAPNLKRILHNAVWDTPASTMSGYSANVTRLHGPGYALLGNAAEFLDPIFSSGITIALRSAKLAAEALHRQLSGETVNWETDFSQPLQVGVETFRAYVEGWYSGEFQDLVFYEKAQPGIRRMISSILAGYAWDTTNPFVAEPRRRLRTLSELCRQSPQR
ncbi:FAD-dependent oxidoreductase [Cephaloticoccus primus]|uniref:FAD-dependent oxidoreductase n=1 Tax=Cephaloticoccus primus TaxID=1548207 RepID=A0A139SQT7_9BACT|nr:FAD-dependent oxidoreductase [Cephaloticoccus primus]